MNENFEGSTENTYFLFIFFDLCVVFMCCVVLASMSVAGRGGKQGR